MLMDQLISQFQDIQIMKTADTTNALVHDVLYILECFDHEQPMLDPGRFKVVPSMISTPTELFHSVISVMSSVRRSHDLVEVLPLVDEYLEYFQGLRPLATQDPMHLGSRGWREHR